MSTLITNIGELVTNDPAGSFGSRTGAALIIDGGRIVWTGPAGRAPAADDIVDARGRAVLPGFVDSHAHLVFAGERGAEFAARMAGQPYTAGGIAATVEATRAASDVTLRAGLRRLADEMVRQGTTTFECKSGYGLTVEDEARSVMLAAEVTPEVTYLGAHVVPPEYGGDTTAYLDLVCGPMLDACAPQARWIDVFCEKGAFSEDEAAAVLAAGRARGLLPRVHANQLAAGPGVRLAVQAGAASADHCTFLTPADVDLLASSEHGGHAAARGGVLLPSALPGRAAAAQRGRDRGDRHRLQSGLVLHLQHGAVRGAGRAGDGHDHRGGGLVGHGLRRPCAAPDRCGAPRRGRPGRPADAGRPVAHLPGVPSRGAADRGRLARGPPGRRPPPGPGRLTQSVSVAVPGWHLVADKRKHFDIDGDQRHGLFSVRAMLCAQPSISGQSRLSPNRPPKAWKNKREGNGH